MKIVNIHESEKCNFSTDIKQNEKTTCKSEFKSNAQRTIEFKNRPKLISGGTVGCKKECEGILGSSFDIIVDDAKWGEKTFELGEVKFLKESIKEALKKAKLTKEDIDIMFSGDLLNQIVTSSFVAREMGWPYMGIYSACSTMTEALTLGATYIDGGYFNTAVCATCSHFATAERQYRYPLEYGNQRPPYAQWTATASGCSILSCDGEGPSITHATIGKVVDFGISDMNNMGAAMAPAAVDTLSALLADLQCEPDDFDMIFTGDLGKLGSDIFRDLCAERGFEIGANYHDCGAMLYGVTQDCYSGGSGAGCMASVLNSFILNRMKNKRLNKVLLMATGALMSPTTSFQGETIPAISHAVVLQNI